MRKLIAGFCFVAIAGFAWAAIAQSSTAAIGKSPGVAVAAATVKTTATITAIDPTKRTFTLRGPNDQEVTLTAGPKVKNFAQMKVGDVVNAEYKESLTLELKKGGDAVVSRTDKWVEEGVAKLGERPAAVAHRQIHVIADVVAVNATTQTVTLKGPNRTVDLKVRDPDEFKLINVGDQVEATYTEALAIAVKPTKTAN